MRRYHYSYPVRLSNEQRRFLEMMAQTSKTLAKHYLVARVLLTLDQSQDQPSYTDGQIAEVLSISRRTVIRDPRSALSKRTWGWLSLEVSLENAPNGGARDWERRSTVDPFGL
jgi:hypothetical protein